MDLLMVDYGRGGSEDEDGCLMYDGGNGCGGAG